MLRLLLRHRRWLKLSLPVPVRGLVPVRYNPTISTLASFGKIMCNARCGDKKIERGGGTENIPRDVSVQEAWRYVCQSAS